MVDTLQYRKKSQFLGGICTLLILALLFLFLWFFVIRTPNPPYPDGGGGTGSGIEVNLGFADAGMGNTPQTEALPEQAKSAEAEPSDASDEKIATQDIEDAPAVVEKHAKKKLEKKPKEKPKVKPVPVKEVQITKAEPVEKVKPQPVVNAKALYPSRTGAAVSNGDKNVVGDQGNPNGNPGTKAFSGNGGSGGSGGGTGGGVGSGVSYSLAGRTPQTLPKPEYKNQVEGVVVVAVTVDKNGRVTQAEPGVKGSTTLDENLLDAAKRAALKANFDHKPDAPAFQKGTITYRFRLQ